MRYRYFDEQRKNLFAFSETCLTNGAKTFIVRMSENFNILFQESEYVGYLINDPLRFIVNEATDDIEEGNSTIDENKLFKCFYN